MAKGGFLACVVIVGICIGGTVANDSSLLQTFEERLANLSDEAKGLAQKYADINTRIHQLQTEYYTLKGHDVPDRQLQKRSFEYYHYGSTVRKYPKINIFEYYHYGSTAHENPQLISYIKNVFSIKLTVLITISEN